MMATGRPSSGMTGRPDMAARPGTASRLAAQAGSARSISPAANERPMTGRENVAESRLTAAWPTIPEPNVVLEEQSKVADTTAETDKIISKSNDLSAQMNFLTTYRAEHEQLSKNVADIRKKQYDYETMLDALAHGITDEELKAEIVEDRAESQKLLAEVQNLLNDRQRREVELKKLQEKASKYEKAGESLLKEMSSEDQRRYHEMQKELLAESEKEDRLVQQYEETKNVERVKLEEELIFSPLKKEACQVLGRIRELESTLDDVNTQINKNPEDEKKRLEEKITKDNAAISALERQSHTLETSHETLRQHFGEGNVSLEKSTEKNAEIQEFLATFSDRKRAAEDFIEEQHQAHTGADS